MKSLKTSLNNLLTSHDQLLYEHYYKLEKKIVKRQGSNINNNSNLSSNEESQKMSESLSLIRKSILRKKKIIDKDQEDKMNNVGKQFSEEIKYTKVENKKALKDLRICAEYRDVIKHTFEAVINNLRDELTGVNNLRMSKTDSQQINERKPIELDLSCLAINTKDLSKRMSSVGSDKNIMDVNMTLQKKSSQNNNLISPNNLYKKPNKNLNDFILKKIKQDK